MRARVGAASPSCARECSSDAPTESSSQTVPGESTGPLLRARSRSSLTLHAGIRSDHQLGPVTVPAVKTSACAISRHRPLGTTLGSSRNVSTTGCCCPVGACRDLQRTGTAVPSTVAGNERPAGDSGRIAARAAYVRQATGRLCHIAGAANARPACRDRPRRETVAWSTRPSRRGSLVSARSGLARSQCRTAHPLPLLQLPQTLVSRWSSESQRDHHLVTGAASSKPSSSVSHLVEGAP